MSTFIEFTQAFQRRLWRASAPLTFVALVMALDGVLAAVGLVADSRLVTGAPVWLKPLKFGVSTAIFAGTLAWLCDYIETRRAFFRTCTWVISAGLIVEIGLIDLQAARGAVSHFNIATGFDAAVFAAMGLIIAVVWLASVGLAVLLFRQRFADRAWGWGLRLGLAISLLGAATGGLMTAPSAEQRRILSEGQHLSTVGRHTVGAPDGGAGIPGLGWSTQHGDLRVPHFVGLHAMQVIPFLMWVFRRRNRPSLPFVLAGSYVSLAGILMWQAYRGQAVVRPDLQTVEALLLWFAVSAIACAAPLGNRVRSELAV